MKVIAINGSPRKDWNTAQMLEAALEGAREKGAETKMINLFDLNFTGCRSCFACKRLGGPNFGRCAWKDDLSEILDEILAADGLVVGTPIYFGEVTGAVRNFYERLFFPCLLYSATGEFAYERNLKVGMIYTTGNPVKKAYMDVIKRDEDQMNMFVGKVQGIVQALDTVQFDDYSKYASSMFSEEAKHAHRDACFATDLANAKELGAGLV